MNMLWTLGFGLLTLAEPGVQMGTIKLSWKPDKMLGGGIPCDGLPI